MNPESSILPEPRIVRSGRWLTKRRGILLTPLFVAALMAARWARTPWLELGQDLLALACLAGGTWLRSTAASYHDSNQDDEPVTAGPYAWVRHPLYLANFLLGLGIVLAAGWWPMVLFYVLFFLPVHTVIARAEEVHLTAQYGEKYERYRHAVPAILPWRPFAGPRYGGRARYKWEHGKEGLKPIGYAAGFLALLAWKELRTLWVMPPVPPLPWAALLAAVVLAVWAVAYRAKMRWAWMRALQTILAVGSVLLLALQVPGMWVGATKEPAAPVSPVVGAMPAAALDQDIEPPEESGVRGWVGRQFWSHLEMVAGMGVFGISALSDEAYEGDAAQRGHELGEAGAAGAISAVAAVFLKQWHEFHQSAFSTSPRSTWETYVRPVVQEDGVGVVTVLKRRF